MYMPLPMSISSDNYSTVTYIIDIIYINIDLQ